MLEMIQNDNHIAEQENENVAACIDTMHECGINLDEPDKDCEIMECRFVCPFKVVK